MLIAAVTRITVATPLLAILAFSNLPAQSTNRQDSVAARKQAAVGIKNYLSTLEKLDLSGMGGGWLQLARDTASVRRAATRLGAVLDSAAQQNPSDDDINSVRVYYRVVHGSYKSAEQLAESGCRRTGWWCSALVGFVRHHDSRFAESIEAFNNALRLMPEEKRCLWNDVSHVLNDAASIKALRGMSCSERAPVNERIWWLSQPLWMEGGNDRLSEHYSRWMTAELAQLILQFTGWRKLDASKMNDPLNALLRVGKLEWYSGLVLGCWTLGKFECPIGRHNGYNESRYVPLGAARLDPYQVDIFDRRLAPVFAGAWAQRNAEPQVPTWIRFQGATGRNAAGDYYTKQGYGEVFASTYGWVHTINDAQVAFIEKNNNHILLAAFEPRNAEVLGGFCSSGYPPALCPSFAEWRNALLRSGMKVGIAANTGPGVPTAVATSELGQSGVARLSVPFASDSAIISLEARSLGEVNNPVAARIRFAGARPPVQAPTSVRNSDIVLYDPNTLPNPENSTQALAAMLPRSTVHRNETIGLYWELYRVTQSGEYDFELAITPLDSATGILGTIARGVGLSSRPGRTLTRWRETATPESSGDTVPVTTHSVTLPLNALESGDYFFTLRAALPGGATVEVVRRVRVK